MEIIKNRSISHPATRLNWLRFSQFAPTARTQVVKNRDLRHPTPSPANRKPGNAPDLSPRNPAQLASFSQLCPNGTHASLQKSRFASPRHRSPSRPIGFVSPNSPRAATCTLAQPVTLPSHKMSPEISITSPPRHPFPQLASAITESGAAGPPDLHAGGRERPRFFDNLQS